MKPLPPEQSTAHLFALYVSHLSSYLKDNTLSILDENITHRINRILRMKVSERLILFDDQGWIEGIVLAIEKNKIIVETKQMHFHVPLQPKIIFLLPLLKKEALARAVEGLVAVGINEIQLITTERIHQRSFSVAEYERCMRIIQAAREQSKQYTPVSLYMPQPLSCIIVNYENSSLRLCADEKGQLIHTWSSLITSALKTILLTAGPEAGFSDKEQILLQQNEFIPCALTPTVLEAWLASTMISAIVRATAQKE